MARATALPSPSAAQVVACGDALGHRDGHDLRHTHVHTVARLTVGHLVVATPGYTCSWPLTARSGATSTAPPPLTCT